ncbi:MAG TPA: hypothetical protein VGJ20_18855 [Xanthobacteraceae bacterium]
MRVSSEKQTLILAGETIPRRPLTLVATPVDEPLLIIQGDSEDLNPRSSVLPSNLIPSQRLADRGGAFSAANAYARTQELSVSNASTGIIDTYA